MSSPGCQEQNICFRDINLLCWGLVYDKKYVTNSSSSFYGLDGTCEYLNSLKHIFNKFIVKFAGA